ncbi:MAG: OB-fold nucleic acid binding domain-containing protein, partial [bacterium]
ALEPALRDTHGIILYQEQVMRIANVISGFTLAQADLMRRAMGKKKREEMEELRDAFLGGIDPSKGVTREEAEKIFWLMDKFAGYGFNKSHSAAYAYLAYQTGYLKANYPVEFMSALLTSVRGDIAKVSRYIEDCRRMGIEVALPDVNVGCRIFTPRDGKIYYGLAAIKNVGEAAVDAIVVARERGGSFTTIFDLCRRVDMKALNVKALEALIRAGACDSLPGNRAQKVEVLEEAAEIGRGAQKDRETGQMSLFGDAAGGDPRLPEREEFDVKQILADEKELLGLYLSHHPLDPHRRWVESKRTRESPDLMSLDPGVVKRVTVAGIVTRFKEFTSKSGSSEFAVVELEDFKGKVLVNVNSHELELYRGEFEEGNVVAVTGRVKARFREAPDGEVRLEPRLICAHVESRRGAAKKARAGTAARERVVHLRIGTDGSELTPARLIEELKRLVSKSRGKTPVVVHVPDEESGGERAVALEGNEIHYTPEFLHLARRFFGDDNVWVETVGAGS